MGRPVSSLLVMMTLILSGCANQDKKDFESYFNSTLFSSSGLMGGEKELMERFDKLRAESNRGDLYMLNVLMRNIIPLCNDLSGKVGEYMSPNHRIREIHELFTKSMSLRCGAFILMADGINKQDLELIQKGNEKLDESSKIVREYLISLKNAKDKYGIKVVDRVS